MSTNLTIGDIVISLLIGIIGSLLAAYFYSNTPQLTRRISDYWSTRSKAAAEKRAKHLTLKLEHLVRLSGKDATLKADTSRLLIDSILYMGTSIICLSLSFFAPVLSGLEKSMPKLSGINIVWVFPIDENTAAMQTVSLFVMFFFLSVTSFILSFRSRDKYIMLSRIDLEIEELRKRIFEMLQIANGGKNSHSTTN